MAGRPEAGVVTLVALVVAAMPPAVADDYVRVSETTAPLPLPDEARAATVAADSELDHLAWIPEDAVRALAEVLAYAEFARHESYRYMWCLWTGGPIQCMYAPP